MQKMGRHPMAILVLGLVVSGCGQQDSKPPVPSPDATSSEEKSPQVRLSHSPKLRSPQINDLRGHRWKMAEAKHETGLAITGKTWSWNGGTPPGLELRAAPANFEICQLPGTQDNTPFPVFIAPEVSASNFTEWVQALTPTFQPIWVAESRDGKKHFRLPFEAGPEIRALPAGLGETPRAKFLEDPDRAASPRGIQQGAALGE